MKKISFLMTSDTHAFWLNRLTHPTANLFNTAGTIEAVRQQRQHPVVTIDLGDFIQGSSFATYCSQEVKDGSCFARAMNALNYDFQIIGNHEFNYGPDYRDSILTKLDSQILLSNIVREADGQPFIGQPYQIIEREGVKIGVIGVTTHYIPHWELPKHYEGLIFLDACETTKKYVAELRPLVDVVVVAYHGGFESDLETFSPLEEWTGENQGAKMLQEIEGIDVLLTGHQHRVINQQVKNTWTVQPGHAGEFVAEVILELDEQHQIIHREGYLHETAQYPALDKLRPQLEPQLSNGQAWLETVLGHAPIVQPTHDIFLARVNGHPFLELLNQVQLQVTGADFSGIALVNEHFADFQGDITNEILLKAYPYYNLITKIKLTGQEIYEVMEYNLEYFELDANGQMIVNPEYISPKPRHYNYDIYSGFKTIVDVSKPKGQRVIELIDERTNQPLEKERIYQLAVTQYRAVGGGDYTMLTQDKIVEITQYDIASELVKALNTFDEKKWATINQHFQHVEWLNQTKMNTDEV